MRARQRFSDRTAAGRRLGAALARMRWHEPVALGLARGGVPVAAGVADALGSPLEVIIARKIGAPGQPELAIGAVTADGSCVYDPAGPAAFGLSEAELAERKDAEAAEARRKEEAYRGHPITLAGCDLVLVDDGLATGLTALAAARALRRQGPGSLTVAAPVLSRAARERLAAEADLVYGLSEPSQFRAVGQWYRDFDQVTDADVQALLRQRSGTET